jgi:hypothetical protein
MVAMTSSPRRGGRQPVTDDQLVAVAVAAAYVYPRQNEFKAPVPFTATHPDISTAKAKDWLNNARGRGILAKADSTRPVGMLTEKGEQLWRNHQGRTAVQKKGGRDR